MHGNACSGILHFFNQSGKITVYLHGCYVVRYEVCYEMVCYFGKVCYFEKVCRSVMGIGSAA